MGRSRGDCDDGWIKVRRHGLVVDMSTLVSVARLTPKTSFSTNSREG